MVQSSAQKLQTSNDHEKAGRDLRGYIAEPPGKYYQSLFCYPLTDNRSQCLARISTPYSPVCFENSYYYKDWCAVYHLSVPQPPKVCKRPGRQGNDLEGSDNSEHHQFALGSKWARRGGGNSMPPLSNWCDRRRCRQV